MPAVSETTPGFPENFGVVAELCSSLMNIDVKEGACWVMNTDIWGRAS